MNPLPALLSTLEQHLTQGHDADVLADIRANLSRLRGAPDPRRTDAARTLLNLSGRFPVMARRLLHRLSNPHSDPGHVQETAAFTLSLTPRPWERVIESCPWTLIDPFVRLDLHAPADTFARWASKELPDTLDGRLARHGVYPCRSAADELLAGLLMNNCLRTDTRPRLDGELIALIGDPQEIRETEEVCDARSAYAAAAPLLPLVASLSVTPGKAQLSFMEGSGNTSVTAAEENEVRRRLHQSGVLPEEQE